MTGAWPGSPFGEWADPATPVGEGDELARVPPVSGGQGPGALRPLGAAIGEVLALREGHSLLELVDGPRPRYVVGWAVLLIRYGLAMFARELLAVNAVGWQADCTYVGFHIIP